MMKMSDPPKILIVDDTESNIDVLVDILGDQYDLSIAMSGERALKLAMEDTPDLILLDIMMPGINGYDTCRKLKESPETLGIPVIFVTARSEVEDEFLGFTVGGVDYITKPLSADIVLSRVRTHIELKQHRDYLEELAEKRAHQLIHAERLATLGTLSAGIAHEISSPLMVISGYAEIIDDSFDRIEKILIPTNTDPVKPDTSIIAEFQDCRDNTHGIIDGVQRIKTLIGNMRKFSRKGNTEKCLQDIEPSIHTALNLCRYKVKHLSGLTLSIPPSLPKVMMNSQQIEQVLINLISNAADAMDSVADAALEVSAETENQTLRIRICDNGPGISEAIKDRIWDAFYTTKDSDRGTGLGLSISKGIIEDHNGTVHSENLPGKGAVFIIELPVV